MIVLTEEEKLVINLLNHPQYQLDYVEQVLNSETTISINPILALSKASVYGYYDAIQRLVKSSNVSIPKQTQGSQDAEAPARTDTPSDE